jgi:hypothetical protein
MIESMNRRTVHLFIRGRREGQIEAAPAVFVAGQIFNMWTLLEICTEFKIKSAVNDHKKDQLKVNGLLSRCTNGPNPGFKSGQWSYTRKTVAHFRGFGHSYVY